MKQHRATPKIKAGDKEKPTGTKQSLKATAHKIPSSTYIGLFPSKYPSAILGSITRKDKNRTTKLFHLPLLTAQVSLFQCHRLSFLVIKEKEKKDNRLQNLPDPFSKEGKNHLFVCWWQDKK